MSLWLADVLGRMDGYLLLADIAGYTKFLTGTELEHSHAIVTELTKLIRSQLVPPTRFVKLEGDAVFCFAGADAFPDGEELLELVESCYFNFASRLLDMTRSTTCTCNACRAIGGLGLKFVVHYGEFIVDRDEDGRVDLAGTQVILAHRLLKNTVVETGGPTAYGFLSEPCFARSSCATTLPVHTESYDSFGEVKGFIADLGAAADRRREAQRVIVSGEDADLDMAIIYNAPPPVLWQYYVQPGRRAEWSMDVNETSITFVPNEDGRKGAGASSHCAHAIGGDALREYQDWRPYEYFTSRLTPLPPHLLPNIPFIETFSFDDLGDGRTEFHWRVRCIDRSDETLAQFEGLKNLVLGSRPNATPQLPPDTSLTAIALAASANVFGHADTAND